MINAVKEILFEGFGIVGVSAIVLVLFYICIELLYRTVKKVDSVFAFIVYRKEFESWYKKEFLIYERPFEEQLEYWKKQVEINNRMIKAVEMSIRRENEKEGVNNEPI